MAAKYGIGNGGTDGRNAGLAHAGRLFGRGHDVNLHLGRFIHAQHAIVVEVALLDAAVLQGDRAIQRRAQSEADAAFHLRFDDVRIDGRAAVNGANHPIDLDATCVIDADLGHLRHEGIERFAHRDAAALALGQGT